MTNINKTIINTALAVSMGSFSLNVCSALPSNATLDFESGVYSCVLGGTAPLNCLYGLTTVATGSYFTMDTDANGPTVGERVPIELNDGLSIGQIQSASGSHTGVPDGSESPSIDLPWSFFGNTGMHYTTIAPAISGDDGAGNVTLDLTGWAVTWNGIALIPLFDASQGDTGVGTMVCGADCAAGDTFNLSYAAHVPLGDESGFGGVAYTFEMVGTISAPNLPPTAASDALLVHAGDSGTIDVTTNGSDDPDGDNTNLTVGALIDGISGTATGVGTNIITYTNTDTSVSSDSFQYTVFDGVDASASETVTVTINAIPVAVDDGASTTPSGSVDINILTNDTDADGNETIDAASVITIPASGDNTANGTITVNAGIVTYSNNGTTGDDTFTYTVADEHGAISDIATVTIDVQADPPPTCNGTTLVLDQDTSAVFIVEDFATAGGAKTLDLATVATPTLPSNGGSAIGVPALGQITYTPDPGYTGADSFTYTVADDTKTCAEATVNITVNSTNTAPVANDDPTPGDPAITTAVNADVGIIVTANDTDDDDISNSTVTITNTPPNGGTSVTGGTVTYTPNTGFSGTDVFTYNLTDIEGAQSLNATVSLTVEATAPSVSTGTLTPGGTADSVGSTDGRISATDIPVTDDGDSAEQGIEQSCIGGCFDYEVSDVASGATVQVVLPLSVAIPTPAEGNTLLYRKFDVATATWSTFDTSGDDAIHTADGLINGSTTTCPSATDSAYDDSSNLTPDHECVRLSIVDGGPNDADGVANGTVVDPGGIADTFRIDTRVSGTSGCSISSTKVDLTQRADWLIVVGFIVWLGLIGYRRNKAVN